jgi:hypothetical protein
VLRSTATILLTAVAALGAILQTASCRAQEPSTPSDGLRPAVRVGHLPPGESIRLDGWLTDRAWSTAPLIGDLTQVEPNEGETPFQHTEVRVLRSDVALYLAIRCRETEPGAIRATQRARDARLDPDDRVEWFLDTFYSRRNAYWFQIGAAGSRGDALITDNGVRFNKSWDCIWDGHAHVTEDGWQAEVMIPFQSLAFAPDSDVWGFNLRRLRRVNNEEDQWANGKRASSFFRIGDAGTLLGMSDLRGGIGLDVKPFALVSGGHDRDASRSATSDVDAGLDLIWRMTPGLTLSATTLTDFAETEVDDRQVNLTRFPLFFPEKREFFLADASRFDFGPSVNSSVFVPFFSRRIGRDDSGNTIPILLGVKLAGQEGPWEIGFLDTWLDRGPGDIDEKNLGVVRIKRQLGEQGSLGMIATRGNPTGATDNHLLGADWNHRFLTGAGSDLRVSAYALSSFTSGDGGDGFAGGIDFNGRTRDWDYDVGMRHIASDFAPELGFIRRSGVDQGYAIVNWRPRPGGDLIRFYRFGINVRGDVRIGGSADDVEWSATPFGFELHSGDAFRILTTRSYDRILEPFEVFGGVTIDRGAYWINTIDFDFTSSEARPVSVALRYRQGGFFDGDERAVSVGFDVRAGALLQLGGRMESTAVELPNASFTSRLAQARVDLHFSPNVSWRNLVQYDNDSRNLSVQSRLRWTITPGSDLFMVLGTGWLRTERDSFQPEGVEATAKLVWTFRF